jgi:uncharacterized NAD(P)/FAD-binding protein YdhS
MTDAARIDVAIIGGGFSGAAVAYHLARLAPGTSIAVFEPRGMLGGGLAYDDHDPAHRINVPAKRMSLLPDDETHFSRWLSETGADLADPGIVGRDGSLYPQRGVFGRYVASHLAPLLKDGHVAHLRSAVDSVKPNGERWRISGSAGHVVDARFVVIAATHPAPDVPGALAPLRGDPRLIGDALVPGVLSGVARDARVVIVGTGLTMADVVASLDRLGHRGPITAFSRRGLRSRGHAPQAFDPYGDFKEPEPNASVLLRKIRRTISDANRLGLPWHSVIDAVRADAQVLWPKLPLSTRSRIVRHLRVYWDVHRFRIAPQVEDVLNRRIADGSLSIAAASLAGAASGRHGVTITTRPRDGGPVRTLEADHVVVTTGPGHGSLLKTQPYLAGLARLGRIKADPLGLGIAVNARSRVLDAEDRPQPTLLVAGPLARATFGELMGLPQVSAHTVSVAEDIAGALAATPHQTIASQVATAD